MKSDMVQVRTGESHISICMRKNYYDNNEEAGRPVRSPLW